VDERPEYHQSTLRPSEPEIVRRWAEGAETLGEHGRTRPGGAGHGGYQNITRPEYSGLAHNGIGELFARCLKEDEREGLFLLFPIAS
jgi:hypothetical protein